MRDIYIIRPVPSQISFREVCRARWMFLSLVRASALLPYVGTRFGYFLTLLRPFVFLAVMVFIKQRSDSQMGETIAYPLFVYTGLILWWYLVDAVKASSRSPITYKGLITKIYYPRIVTPAIPVFGRLFDLVIQGVGILLMMLLFWNFPGKNVWILPIVIFNIMLLALGLGYIFSVASIAFRDFDRVLDYMLYIGLFISPVLYAPAIIPAEYQEFYAWVNPVVGPLGAFRSALFADVEMNFRALFSSLFVSSILFVVGVSLFQRAQANFVEKM